MMRYRTRHDDMVDRICHTYYGTSRHTVEAVLEANPGLADFGARLPEGRVILLPDLPEPVTATDTIRLWE